MIIINPCNCGGIPFIAQHYDLVYDEMLYFVICYKCKKNSNFECSEDSAILQWNNENNYEFKKDN